MGKLLINEKNVSVAEFIEKIQELTSQTIPLEEIKGNLEFAYNTASLPIDLGKFRQTGMRIKSNKKSDDVLAQFDIFDENSGETVSFRYVDTAPYRNVKTDKIVYTPVAIEFPGSYFSFEKKDLEKVIYLYCHPHCFDSPLYTKGKPYKYSHVNLKKEVRAKSNKINKIDEAFKLIESRPDDQLKPLAIGLGIDLIPNADAGDIRTALKEEAMRNPFGLVEQIEAGVVIFEGMIQSAVDDGVINQKQVGDQIIWSYNKGPKRGVQIVAINSVGSDAVRELKNYMTEHVDQYYPELTTYNRSIASNANASKYLNAALSGSPVADVKPHKEFMKLSDVVDFKTGESYLIENSNPALGKPSNVVISKFYKAVLAGDIHEDNIDVEIVNYAKV